MPAAGAAAGGRGGGFERASGLLHSAASAEAALAEALHGGFGAAPLRVHDPHECTADVLDLGGERHVAVATATLHASYELVVCRSPYERGWLAATAALSELAAVGAEPRALVLSWSFVSELASHECAGELARGAADATSAQGAHVAGARTSRAGEESLTGCAVGVVDRGRALTRAGAHPGDALWATGPIGRGNVAAVLNLRGEPGGEPWRPSARCAAGVALARGASACTTTADGLLAAAVLLADVNSTGVEVDESPALYDGYGIELVARLGLPRWLLSAGEWGEHELLFAVPPEREARCVEAVAATGAEPVRVGRLVARRELSLRLPDGEAIGILPLLERLRGVDAPDSLIERLTGGAGA